MFLTFEDRPSDSPLIERVWRCRSNGGGAFLSVAAGHVELVVTRLAGQAVVTLRGPETRATSIDCPPGGEWFAIRFRPGVHLPQIPTRLLLDHQDMNLPVAADGTFVFGGARWVLPDFENAEAYADRLARRGVIMRDPAVEAVLTGDRPELSERSIQRHFRDSTALTHGMFRQIERARHATNLLRAGTPILDVVHAAGYFDQAHLSRALKEFIGQTPAGIGRGDTQLSFLYKTDAQSRD